MNYNGTLAVIHVQNGADVLQRSGSNWSVLHQLRPPFLGSTVYGNYTLVALSADSRTVVIANAPNVLIYWIDATGFSLAATLSAPPDAVVDFGTSVVFSANQLLIGSQTSNKVWVYASSQFGDVPITFVSPVTMIGGSATFAAGFPVSFAPNALVVVNGTLTIAPGAVAQVTVSANSVGLTTLVSASSIVGAQLSVTAVSSSSCTASVSGVTQTATSISATVSLSCGSGWSTGAIVGLVVGVVVGGVLIGLGIAFLTRQLRKRDTAHFNKELRNANMLKMNASTGRI